MSGENKARGKWKAPPKKTRARDESKDLDVGLYRKMKRNKGRQAKATKH